MVRLGLVLWALAAGASAGGKPPPEAARLFDECLAVVEARKLEAARTCFERVYALYPSPVVLSNLGRIEERLGHWVEAYESYRHAGEDATGALTRDERRDLGLRVGRLAGRVGLVRVQAVEGATVVIDGRRRAGRPGVAFAVLPGRHEIAVEAPGRTPWRGAVVVRARETVAVTAALDQDPAGPRADDRPPPGPPVAVPVPAPRAGSRTGAWLTAGSGVVLLGVGAAMTGLWARRAADANALLDDRDATGRPLPFSQVATRYNRARADFQVYRGAALGLCAAAAVVIGVSTYLLVRSGRRGTAERLRAGLRLAPVVAPAGAGLWLAPEL